MSLRDDLATLIRGDVSTDTDDLAKHSRDTSIFQILPRVVVYPKDPADVAATVRYAHDTGIPLAARAAGTDMTGGPLTDSIALSFTRYMNHISLVGPDFVITQPGVFYRDLEKETLTVSNAIIPSYPASRELAALGGMIGNNSGGELTLRYGKTDRYVQELEVVLADGSMATFKPLTAAERAAKEQEQTFEGQVYQRMRTLVEQNSDDIQRAKPMVSKNSAGYALWDVQHDDMFDLTKLIVGSQGTLGIVTKAKLGLVTLKKHRQMMVMFLNDIHDLPEVVRRVMKYDPESFESYDDQTFKLAVRFLPQIIGHFGIVKILRLGLAFIPELRMVLTGGVPKLILMAEFAEDSHEAAFAKAQEARHLLADLPVQTKLARGEMDSKKYWIIRREAFALLRKNLQGLYASPFIDDCVVPIESYPTFIPALNSLLKQYDLIYTIQGHIGNGNFHIIPLMDLSNENARTTILELTPKVYDLVAQFDGSTTGEHNDGIIRTPYLNTMFSPRMLELFAETKRIFDPKNILNPGKKVGGTTSDIEKYMIKSR